MKVPLIGLKDHNNNLTYEVWQLWDEIYTKSQFVSGKYVRLFEEAFAKACRVKHCIAVGSGSDALLLSLLALDLKPTDEVITTSATFVATIHSIVRAGARPIFVDIDPNMFNINAYQVEQAITEKTVGILPVHLYGNPANMITLEDVAKRHNLWILEDACQAHLAEFNGRKVGTFGKAAAFSFYPTKNIGAAGEAGCITTNDDEVCERVKALRDNGRTSTFSSVYIGHNAKCDELQAAMLYVKLKYLEEWNRQRRRCAQLYGSFLEEVEHLQVPAYLQGSKPVWHQYVVLQEHRDKFRAYLLNKGIETGLHYPVPVHRHEAYPQFNHLRLPVTEHLSTNCVSLPMYPEMHAEMVDYVCNHIKGFLKETYNL